MLYFFNCKVGGEHAEKLFHTGWFVESLLTQTLIVHIIRTNKIPFIESAPSLPLLLGTITVMGIASWLPYSFMAEHLGLVALPASFWLWMVAFLAAYSVLCHLMKVWFIKKFGTD